MVITVAEARVALFQKRMSCTQWTRMQTRLREDPLFGGSRNSYLRPRELRRKSLVEFYGELWNNIADDELRVIILREPFGEQVECHLVAHASKANEADALAPQRVVAPLLQTAR